MSAAVAAKPEEPIQELNTTPLIEVMLVLLIMFIMTIPVQTHSVDIDLPREVGVVVNEHRNKVAITQNGAVLWNGTPREMLQLRAALAEVARRDPPPELHVEPHAEARYQVVDQVLAVIRRADVHAMGFVGNERYATF